MLRKIFVSLATAGAAFRSLGPVAVAAAPSPTGEKQGQPQFARANHLVTSFMEKYAIPAAAIAIADEIGSIAQWPDVDLYPQYA